MLAEIISWNVNGLRAAHKKGFVSFLEQRKPVLLGLQEVRAETHQLPAEIVAPPGYSVQFVPARRAGYSGVAIYAASSRPFSGATFDTPLLDTLSEKKGKTETVTAYAFESFDAEGRIICVKMGKLLVVNGYFPNGNGKERDNSRVPYKLEFYERVLRYLEPAFKANAPILVMGDFNTAHRAVDLARPKQNLTTSGFLPEEREVLDRWFARGWVDTFRYFCPAPTADEILELEKQAKRDGVKKADRKLHPGEGQYTWWSQRGGAREKNVGWRIDYILASPGALPYIKGARIYPEVKSSDHCPISVLVDPAVLT